MRNTEQDREREILEAQNNIGISKTKKKIGKKNEEKETQTDFEMW